MNRFSATLWARDHSHPVYPEGVRIEVLRYAWEADGGPSWACLTVSGTRQAVSECLEWLRLGVKVSNPLGEDVWWGYVRSVWVTLGSVSMGASLEDLANRVAAKYRRVVPGEVPETLDVLTAWATNADSASHYGTKELIVETTTQSVAVANAARDSALEDLGLPRPVLEDVGDGARATVWCRGWWDTLSWKYYSQAAGLEEQRFYNISQKIGLQRTSTWVGMVSRAYEVCDVGGKLGGFEIGDKIVIDASAHNDGTYTVAGAARRSPWSYTANTISFGEVDFTFRIQDTAGGLARIQKDDYIKVSGSGAGNDGFYRVDSVSTAGLYLVLGRAVNNEIAGANITVEVGHSLRVAETLEEEAPFENIAIASYGVMLAQSVRAPAGTADWAASGIEVRACRIGNPVDNLRIDVLTDNAGSPDAYLGGCSISGASLGLAQAWVSGTFDQAVTISAGASVWVVVYRSGLRDPDNYYRVWLDENASYARGTLKMYVLNAGYQTRVPAASLSFRMLGEQDIAGQVADIIASAGQFLAGCEVIDAAGVSSSQYCDGYATAKAEIGARLGYTAAGARLMATVRSDRVVEVKTAPAGSDIAYRLRSNGELYDRWGVQIQPGVCPAGQWIGLDDVIPGSADVSHYGRVSPFFCERALFDCQSLTLRVVPVGGKRIEEGQAAGHLVGIGL